MKQKTLIPCFDHRWKYQPWDARHLLVCMENANCFHCISPPQSGADTLVSWIGCRHCRRVWWHCLLSLLMRKLKNHSSYHIHISALLCSALLCSALLCSTLLYSDFILLYSTRNSFLQTLVLISREHSGPVHKIIEWSYIGQQASGFSIIKLLKGHLS